MEMETETAVCLLREFDEKNKKRKKEVDSLSSTKRAVFEIIG